MIFILSLPMEPQQLYPKLVLASTKYIISHTAVEVANEVAMYLEEDGENDELDTLDVPTERGDNSQEAVHMSEHNDIISSVSRGNSSHPSAPSAPSAPSTAPSTAADSNKDITPPLPSIARAAAEAMG